MTEGEGRTMVELIKPEHLAPFANIDEAKAIEMIKDATATALLAAPCLQETQDEILLDAARAILRRVILRWEEGGSAGSTTQVGAGPFQQSIDVRRPQGLFWPSEIEALQDLCRGASSGAYAVDTIGLQDTVHAPWCNLHFGATYCSCGADIAGHPIFGGGV